MLKEYLAEAISLLVEGLLGKPIQAWADHDCVVEDAVFSTCACFLCCGADKERFAWFRRICCHGSCSPWTKISNDWCNWCGSPW
jgi:hypothetical protein